MVMKKGCQECDSTGYAMKCDNLVMVCPECKGRGYQEHIETPMQKASIIAENPQVSVLMRCVAAHVTREQFETIVDEYYHEKE